MTKEDRVFWLKVVIIAATVIMSIWGSVDPSIFQWLL